MKQKLAFLFALQGWTTVILQFYLMMETSIESKPETIIRFFSYFTILTNILVATCFTLEVFKINVENIVTPATVYITIVGLTYQILLRHTWNPEGLQKIVDELLHSVIPLLTIIYWFVYAEMSQVKYKHIFSWMIYPLVYLIYILLRGNYSGFYPYPFVNVTNLGLTKVLVNSALLLVVFALISAGFIWIGKRRSKNV